MKSFVLRLCIVVSGLCLVLPQGRAATNNNDQKPKEPGLEQIISILKTAKTIADPAGSFDLADKQIAKELKKNANSDKQKDKDAKSDLEKAQKAVGEAKEAFTAGKKDEMASKLDHAISEVKMAITARSQR